MHKSPAKTTAPPHLPSLAPRLRTHPTHLPTSYPPTQVRTLDPLSADLFTWAHHSADCAGNLGDQSEILLVQLAYIRAHYPWWDRGGHAGNTATNTDTTGLERGGEIGTKSRISRGRGADHFYFTMQDRGLVPVPREMRDAIMVTHFPYQARHCATAPRRATAPPRATTSGDSASPPTALVQFSCAALLSVFFPTFNCSFTHPFAYPPTSTHLHPRLPTYPPTQRTHPPTTGPAPPAVFAVGTRSPLQTRTGRRAPAGVPDGHVRALIRPVNTGVQPPNHRAVLRILRIFVLSAEVWSCVAFPRRRIAHKTFGSGLQPHAAAAGGGAKNKTTLLTFMGASKLRMRIAPRASEAQAALLLTAFVVLLSLRRAKSPHAAPLLLMPDPRRGYPA